MLQLGFGMERSVGFSFIKKTLNRHPRAKKISFFALSTCLVVVISFQACSQLTTEGKEDQSSRAASVSPGSDSHGAPDMSMVYTSSGKIQLACSDTSKPPAPTAINRTLRLTKQQYLNTVTALLTGVGVAALSTSQVNTIFQGTIISSLTNEQYSRIYVTYSRMSADTVPDTDINNYIIIAEQIGNLIAAESTWSSIGDIFVKAYAGTANCSDLMSNACKTNFTRNFGLKALRRPLSDQEVQQLSLIVIPTNVPVSNVYDYYSYLIARILLQPSFLFRLKDDGKILSGNLAEISQYDLASELSYSLWDSMPDQRLFDLAGQSGQQLIANLSSELDRMISDIKAKPVFWNFYREWLLIDILGPKSANDVSDNLRTKFNLNYDKYGNLDFSSSSGLGNGAADQVIAKLNADSIATQEFFDFYTRRNSSGTLQDLFTSKRHFVQNADLGKIYGLASSQLWNGNDSQVLEFDSDQYRDGFLNRVVALSASNEGVRNIMRGVRIKRHILCDSMVPQNQGEGATIVKDTYSEKELTKQITEAPGTSCVTCHKPVINPFGFSFYNMDMFGRLRKEEVVYKKTYDIYGNISNVPLIYPVDSTQTVELDPKNPSFHVNNGAELSKALSQSEKVKLCASRQYYHYVQSRFSSDLNACEIQSMYDSFRGSSLRDSIKAIYLHPNYRKKLLR